MAQIILTIEDNALLPKLKNAVRLLNGVIGVKVVKDETAPNKETIEAIEECKNNRGLERINANSAEKFIAAVERL